MRWRDELLQASVVGRDKRERILPGAHADDRSGDLPPSAHFSPKDQHHSLIDIKYQYSQGELRTLSLMRLVAVGRDLGVIGPQQRALPPRFVLPLCDRLL